MERLLSANSWWESPTHSHLNAKKQKLLSLFFLLQWQKEKDKDTTYIIFGFTYLFSILALLWFHSHLRTGGGATYNEAHGPLKSYLKYNFTHFTPTTWEKQSTVVSGRNSGCLNFKALTERIIFKLPSFIFQRQQLNIFSRERKYNCRQFELSCDMSCVHINKRFTFQQPSMSEV